MSRNRLHGRRRQCEHCDNYVLEEYLDGEGCPACRN
jgi:Zn finger protein HypA/HybF involved in hydrogenase expression